MINKCLRVINLYFQKNTNQENACPIRDHQPFHYLFHPHRVAVCTMVNLLRFYVTDYSGKLVQDIIYTI